MTTLISHNKSMTLNLRLSPVQVFDGENKVQNPQSIRKERTKSRITHSRSSFQWICFNK
jgi:hypothetical protein